MSSTLRSVAQIPARIKYLVAVANSDNAFDTIVDDSCYMFSTSSDLDTMISNNALPSSTSYESYNAGDLLKDLGRQVVVYDAATGAHLVVYRQVQRVNGADYEGVPSDFATAMYVRVWAASGAGVLVARTGPGAH